MLLFTERFLLTITLREQIFAGTNFRGWMGQNGQVLRNLFSR